MLHNKSYIMGVFYRLQLKFSSKFNHNDISLHPFLELMWFNEYSMYCKSGEVSTNKRNLLVKGFNRLTMDN
uniref:Ovule protein n=1 Tax=Panagrellus redivivus TaxID=6233 RepID=A0A7E4VNY5_PANRE